MPALFGLPGTRTLEASTDPVDDPALKQQVRKQPQLRLITVPGRRPEMAPVGPVANSGPWTGAMPALFRKPQRITPRAPVARGIPGSHNVMAKIAFAKPRPPAPVTIPRLKRPKGW